jgi:hypothetical protein
LVFHADLVDSVDTRKQTVFIATNMGKVSFLNALERIKITVGHGLGGEFFVVGKEEETSTFTLRLTSPKNHAAVDFWVKRYFQDFVIIAILLAEEGEDVWGVLSDNDLIVNNQFVFKLGLDLLTRGTESAIAVSSKIIYIILNLVDVPIVAVLNFYLDELKLVNVFVVVVLVNPEIIHALRHTYSMCRHSNKNDVNELNIKRAMQKAKQSTIYGIIFVLVCIIKPRFDN